MPGADVPWRDDDGHRFDDWAAQPSEDFAEIMVLIWSDGRWEPRTTDFAPAPDDEELDAIRVLVFE